MNAEMTPTLASESLPRTILSDGSLLVRRSDRALLAATSGHAVALVGAAAFAPRPLASAIMALGVWWGSNTLAHLHVHTPLFRDRRLDRALSLYLTLLLSVPQTLWKRRHLAHHAGTQTRRAVGPEGRTETVLLAVAWGALAWFTPSVALALALGLAFGLGLAWMQGRFEHAAAEGPPVSHYGRLHNLLFFNDGHHVEHHRCPTAHWTQLPSLRRTNTTEIAVPPVFVPLAAATNAWVATVLGWLERLPIHVAWVRAFMVRTQARALASAIGPVAPSGVVVVGGGLFPRTALAVRALYPRVPLRIVDASEANVAVGRKLLPDADIAWEVARFDPARHVVDGVVVFPLAFVGDRDALYRLRTAATLLVHDWAWRRRGTRGVLVSRALMKRLNVVEGAVRA